MTPQVTDPNASFETLGAACHGAGVRINVSRPRNLFHLMEVEDHKMIEEELQILDKVTTSIARIVDARPSHCVDPAGEQDLYENFKQIYDSETNGGTAGEGNVGESIAYFIREEASDGNKQYSTMNADVLDRLHLGINKASFPLQLVLTLHLALTSRRRTHGLCEKRAAHALLTPP